jgi:membrane protease YdiL (CAAX protease family)
LKAAEITLWQLAIAEGGFAVVGLIIIYARGAVGSVSLRLPYGLEAAIGLPLGVLLGAAIGSAILLSPLRDTIARGLVLLRRLIANLGSILLVGLLAGVGEELLFRAALQPWLGIIAASLLFGLTHSGTARLNEGVSVGKLTYVLGTMVAGYLLGILYVKVGLLASISAHAGFDIAILMVLAPALRRAITTA